MAIKKSQLYSSLWASCDELRGGMDASQYKDYVLFMLFIKYVSDKYGNYDGFEPPVVIPKGSSFTDMIALKGKSDIGDKINTQVIQRLVDSNSRLSRHDCPTASILSGNTLAAPKFKDGENLRTYDYVVANPPFSDKTWSTGITPADDLYQRFQWGEPPRKQGDYAYLLHIIRSLKSKGKGACILPHGVLFRGNAEAVIRQQLVRSGYLKGIIGLPANLFYGTGIPACILVLDKENATGRRGIFMIDASDGYMKDGPKNRLRSQDIHKIVDVFNRQQEIPGYSKIVSFDEIEKNEFNLNLPRYIDSRQAEDLHDIAGHLYGGIPVADVDSLAAYWNICPGLRSSLFTPRSPRSVSGRGAEGEGQYLDLAVDKADIKSAIYEHPDFATFITQMNDHFATWRKRTAKSLRKLAPGVKPKQIIGKLSEDLLSHYDDRPLINHYDVYQHLMDYWADVMQDDVYQITAPLDQGGGWKAETYRVFTTDNRGRQRDRGWECGLVPKPLIVSRYFADQQAAIDQLQAELENVSAQQTELEEEHGGEEGVFGELDRINTANVNSKASALKTEIAELKAAKQTGTEEFAALKAQLATVQQWQKHATSVTSLKRQIRDAETELDDAAYAKYPELTEDEVKSLVVDDKWLTRLDGDVLGEMDRISQSLTQRVNELGERYETPLPELTDRVAEWEAKVNEHLLKMGFGAEISGMVQ